MNYASVPDFGLVPRPRALEALSGSFNPGAAPRLSLDPAFKARGALALKTLSAASGLSWSLADSGSAALSARRVDGLPPEGYTLNLAPEGARLEASTEAGFLHGIQSLRALFLLQGPVLAACRIEDEPRFPWRGYMLDCARSFFRVEFIEKMLDLAALHKLNRFHWHLSDDQSWRLDLAALPELAREGSSRPDTRYYKGRSVHKGSYSEADVARVVAYAAERGIEVVPEVEFPGHVTALLASHPELACVRRDYKPTDQFGIFEDVLCLGNDAVLNLVGKVLDELVRLFPGRWIHTGGDEVPTVRWAECPRCLERVKSEGLESAKKLQGWFTREVAHMIMQRGRVPAFWDEALEAGVPKGSLVFAWRGASKGPEAAAAGVDAVMCPSTKACYLDHRPYDSPEEPGQHAVCTVADSYRFEPQAAFVSGGAERVLGVQGNLWSEVAYVGRQAEYQTFPRLSAIAETGWSPKERKDFASFGQRLEAWGPLLDQLDVNRYRGLLE